MLCRVVLEEGLEEGATNQRNTLGLKVGDLLAVNFCCLLGNEGAGLVRAVGSGEELVNGSQVHGHRVDNTVNGGPYAVNIRGKGGETIDVLPHALIGGVEEVCAVLMNFDTGFRINLRVGIATKVRATLNDCDAEAPARCGLLSNCQAEEARSDDNEVIVHGRTPFNPSQYKRKNWTDRVIGPSTRTSEVFQPLDKEFVEVV